MQKQAKPAKNTGRKQSQVNFPALFQNTTLSSQKSQEWSSALAVQAMSKAKQSSGSMTLRLHHNGNNARGVRNGSPTWSKTAKSSCSTCALTVLLKSSARKNPSIFQASQGDKQIEKIQH